MSHCFQNGIENTSFETWYCFVYAIWYGVLDSIHTKHDFGVMDILGSARVNGRRINNRTMENLLMIFILVNRKKIAKKNAIYQQQLR